MRVAVGVRRCGLLCLLTVTAAAVACSEEPRPEGRRSGEGVGSPPEVLILRPTDGAVYDYGDRIRFDARVQDVPDPPSLLALRWFSSLSGELSTQDATTRGVSTFVVDDLLPGQHTVTLAVTDSDGNRSEASVRIDVRPATTAPVVTIEPSFPRTIDDLVAVVGEPPNGGGAIYNYAWRVDGEMTEITGSTLGSEYTSKGQLWTVVVVGHTVLGDTPPGTAQALVVNTAPSCARAAFVPARGDTTTTFDCVCTERWDPDPDDGAYDTCTLGRNGVDLGLESSCRVPAELTSKGDLLSCSITVADDEEGGPPRTATPLEVGSAPPMVGTVVITADECGVFTCEAANLTDADPDDAGFSVDYRWSHNGVMLGDIGPQLFAKDMAQGDQVTCHARATDGTQLEDGALLYGPELLSAPASVSVRVSSVEHATLLPASPVRGDLLTCVPFGFDPVGCGWEPTYRYGWLQDGTIVEGATSSTFSVAEEHEGSAIRCVVTPNGGAVPGLPVTSNGVTVETLEPGAPAVELLIALEPQTTATCRIRTQGSASMTDARWMWSLSGGAAFEAGQSLGGAAVEPCDLVACWLELPNGGEPVTSNEAQALLPRGDGCNDGNPCTTGRCSPAGGCEYLPTEGTCQVDDSCAVGGTCTDGVCVADATVVCDDDDPCTDDYCHPLGGCRFAPSTGSACDDGDSCTTLDICSSGRCAGRNVCGCSTFGDCDDRNSCTSDSCVDGQCIYTDVGGACDDGDACTDGDQCVAGVCTGSTPQPCSDLYLDADGDGFGTGEPQCLCAPTGVFTATQAGDCNDRDAAVHPDAEELVGDRIDSNCDGAELCYLDADLDGYRSQQSVASTSSVACNAPGEALAASEEDCDDGDASISPASIERPGDGIDSNCDARELCFLDTDRDGYRSELTEEIADLTCTTSGYAAASAGADCDDSRDTVNPSMTELSDDGIDSDCDGKELFNGNLLTLSEPISDPIYVVGISGDFDMGALGVVHVDGSVERNADGGVTWCVWATGLTQTLGVVELQGVTAQVCLSSLGEIETSVRGSASIVGNTVAVEGTYELTSPQDYLLMLSGQGSIDGDSFPLISGEASSFVRRTDGEQFWQIALAAGPVPLGPGVVLENTTYIINSKGTSLSATTRFGDVPDDVALTATGEYFVNGDYAITLELAEGETWDPFRGILPLEFSAVSGTLSRTDGLVEVTLTGTVAIHEVEVVPGLILTGASVTGTVDVNGNWSVELSGDTEVDFGDGNVYGVTVTGGLDSAGVFFLQGDIQGTLEPLADLIGPERFVLRGTSEQPFSIGFEVDTQGGTFTVALDAPMEFCTFATDTGCQQAFGVVAHGEGTIGNGFVGYFAAVLEDLELPGFGTLPSVPMIAATGPVDDVDLFLDGSILRSLPRGITLAFQSDSPLPLPGLAGPFLFMVSLGGDPPMTVTADFGLELPIIRPEDGYPTPDDGFATIEYATLTRVFFDAKIYATGIALGIGSEVVFKPINQDETLLGSVHFDVDPITLEGGGMMALLGLWYEPFLLRDYAVQNPGFEINVNFASSVPVPTRLGWNLDVFWLKSGAWPPPELLDPDPEATTPENVLKVGSTFLFDAFPTPSGFCLLGACAPLPPFILRFELDNLTLDDVVKATNDTMLALTQPFEGIIPNGEIARLNPSPVTVDISTMYLAASTHTLVYLGQPFDAGVFVELNATVNGVKTLFDGALDPSGLAVVGQQDGFYLDGLTLVGDPMRHDAIPGAGAIEVPDNDALSPTTGMVEGWVRRGDWSASPVAASLASKSDGSNGYVFGVGAAEGGKGKVVLQILNEGTVRTVESGPVVVTDEDVHLGWQFDESAVALYVNGRRQSVLDSGPAVEPGPNDAPLRLGEGMERIDDVRIWGKLRSSKEIRQEGRDLPTRYINPAGSNPTSELIARYEFDWDAGSTATNSRLYESGASLHGTYVGGATRQRRVSENPKELFIDLRNPLYDPFSPPVPPGFGLKAGFEVNVPPVPPVTMKAAGKFGDGSYYLKFHAFEFPLLPLGIPDTESYLGTLWVGGLGPNLHDEGGAFDDGPYGEADFGQIYFAGTGRFEFIHDGGDIDRWAEATFILDGRAPYMMIDGMIDLLVPFGGGSFGIAGDGHLSTRTNPILAIDGDVEIFGVQHSRVWVEITTERAAFEDGWKLPVPPFLSQLGTTADDLAGQASTYVIDFESITYCGTTSGGVLGEGCTITTCLSATGLPEYFGSCFGTPLCQNHVCENDPAWGPLAETCGASNTFPTCTDDCGLCPDGTACLVDAVCASDVCNLFTCAPADSVDNGGLCNNPKACMRNLPCNPPGRCGKVAFEACTADNECQSNVCAADPFGGEWCWLCATDADCSGGQTCSFGECRDKVGAGGACSSPSNCYSGVCVSFVCVSRCGDNRCDGLEECGGSNAPVTDPLECNQDCGKCPNGEICEGSSDCSSGNCLYFVCAPADACISNNSRCSDGPIGELECCSRRCEGSAGSRYCRACAGLGTGCNEPNDCCTGLCSPGGSCCKSTGQTCGGGGDCCSGLCVAGYCVL